MPSFLKNEHECFVGATGPIVQALEQRWMLAITGLGAAVAQQPTGSLTGKIVYTHGGHGSTAAYPGDARFDTQRPYLLEMVEDLGNQDQMTAYANYLFRAGATIVPLRPVGHQSNEVVVDNDSAGFSVVSGGWSNGSSNPYFALSSAVPTARYRSATSAVTETAVARFTPTIPQAGFYPVYAWALDGSNRAPDQLYRINHSAGAMEVKVNHKMVGKGWVYLGTYHFDSGTAGNVEVSNKTAVAGTAIIADAIRFGNGMGDFDRGAGISGLHREDEAGIYWMKRMAGYNLVSGVVTEVDESNWYSGSTDANATVGSSPRYAAYMNNSGQGTIADRVFLSYHSNAGGGRGTVGLYNGNNNIATKTPSQFEWASLIGNEVNDDMVALSPQLEHAWFDNASPTLDRSDIEFGEINNLSINNEFDATILEVAYHDDTDDAELLRDPKVRNAVARSSVQATIKYFQQEHGSTATTLPPELPTGVKAVSSWNGSLTISWTAPGASVLGSGAPTGYRIYTSTNGYAFDGGIYVAGGATTSHVIPAASLGSAAVYFRVASVNAGGESEMSPLVAARKNVTGKAPILLVNGFSRFERTTNYRQTIDVTDTSITNVVSPVTLDRVYPGYNNSFNYLARAGEAIEAYAPVQLGFDSVDLASFASVNLSDYQAVIWLAGEQSSADKTFDAAQQAAVTNFVNGGGRLFVSGSEVGWDLVALGNGTTFFNNTLHSTYVSDDANTYAASGVSGSIFQGISLDFANGSDSDLYDVTFPDRLSAPAGSVLAMNYVGGSAGGASTTWAGASTQRAVMMGFPFESIVDVVDRNAVMSAVLGFFAIDTTPPTVTSVFNYLNAQSVGFTFSESVIGSFTTADLTLLQLPSTTINPALMNLNYGGGQTSPTLTFTGLLANGNYRLTVAASGVTDASKVYLASDHVLDFFVLAADANRDRKVNTQDFNLLVGNFGQAGRNFAQGNFNYSGLVDSTDFAILAGNYGTVLPAPAAAPPALTVVASDSLFGEFEIDSTELLEL